MKEVDLELTPQGGIDIGALLATLMGLAPLSPEEEAMFDQPEPIGIGETTLLKDRKITGVGYASAPTPFHAQEWALANEAVLRAQGIDPFAVTHVVLRDPRTLSDDRKAEGAYVTTSKFIINDGEQEEPSDEVIENTVYVRVE